MRSLLVAILLVTAATAPRPAAGDGTITDWPYYGGDPGGSRYSPLTQIDRSNVAQLTLAWEYHTGDVSDGSDNRRKSEFEATPIVVGNTMYLSTPFGRVVALDPETGREKWTFDPKIDLHAPYSEGLVSRGVTLWTDPGKAESEACRRRIFLATIDARLFGSVAREWARARALFSSSVGSLTPSERTTRSQRCPSDSGLTSSMRLYCTSITRAGCSARSR